MNADGSGEGTSTRSASLRRLALDPGLRAKVRAGAFLDQLLHGTAGEQDAVSKIRRAKADSSSSSSSSKANLDQQGARARTVPPPTASSSACVREKGMPPKSKKQATSELSGVGVASDRRRDG